MIKRENLVRRNFDVFDDIGVAYRNMELWGKKYMVMYDKCCSGEYIRTGVHKLNLEIKATKPSRKELPPWEVGNNFYIFEGGADEIQRR